MCYSISPGNVMTPLWEELAGQTPDAAAAIQMGENTQVRSHRKTQKTFYGTNTLGCCKPAVM